jgi:hypothetical protein
VGHDGSSEFHNEVERTQWRELFRPIGSVKTLGVLNPPFGGSKSLCSEDVEMPLERFAESAGTSTFWWEQCE